MRQLEKEHMTAAIVGKRLIGSSDMKLDNLEEVTTFMQIIGGDNIHVNVKCGACYRRLMLSEKHNIRLK